MRLGANDNAQVFWFCAQAFKNEIVFAQEDRR